MYQVNEVERIEAKAKSLKPGPRKTRLLARLLVLDPKAWRRVTHKPLPNGNAK